jgi:hypothetical protein
MVELAAMAVRVLLVWLVPMVAMVVMVGMEVPELSVEVEALAVYPRTALMEPLERLALMVLAVMVAIQAMVEQAERV